MAKPNFPMHIPCSGHPIPSSAMEGVIEVLGVFDGRAVKILGWPRLTCLPIAITAPTKLCASHVLITEGELHKSLRSSVKADFAKAKNPKLPRVKKGKSV